MAKEKSIRKLWGVLLVYTHTSPKARDRKERINKWDLIKIKSLCMAKENSTKIQENQQYGKTYLPMIPQTRKGLISKIHKELT